MGCVENQAAMEITVRFPKFHQPKWDGLHNQNIDTVICVLLCLIFGSQILVHQPSCFKNRNQENIHAGEHFADCWQA